MNKLSEKIVSMLKSNAYKSVYINTLAKLPIVVTREGTYLKGEEQETEYINGDTYPISLETNKEYADGVSLIVNNIIERTVFLTEK